MRVKIFSLLLRLIGDTMSSMYSTLIVILGIRVVEVYMFGIVFEWGIAGVWFTITLDLLIRSCFLSWQFNAKVFPVKINN